MHVMMLHGPPLYVSAAAAAAAAAAGALALQDVQDKHAAYAFPAGLIPWGLKQQADANAGAPRKR
jgi:hypothetical protein